MDNSRMNSFLEYAICNRGTSSYSPKGYHHLEQGTASFPACSVTPASDSYHEDGRLGAGGSTAAPSHLPQQSPGYHPTPSSGLAIPFPGAASAGYPPQAYNLSYGHPHFYLGQQDADGAYFQAPGYGLNAGSNLSSLPEGYCGAVAAPGQYQQHSYGQEQPGYLPGAYSGLSPSLNESKDHACPSEQCPTTSATQTFDWMRVKRNPPKTGGSIASSPFKGWGQRLGGVSPKEGKWYPGVTRGGAQQQSPALEIRIRSSESPLQAQTLSVVGNDPGFLPLFHCPHCSASFPASLLSPPSPSTPLEKSQKSLQLRRDPGAGWKGASLERTK